MYCQLGCIPHPARPTEVFLTGDTYYKKDGILASLDLKSTYFQISSPKRLSLLKGNNADLFRISSTNFTLMIHAFFQDTIVEFKEEVHKTYQKFQIKEMEKVFTIKKLNKEGTRLKFGTQLKVSAISIQNFKTIIDFLKSTNLLYDPIHAFYIDAPKKL